MTIIPLPLVLHAISIGLSGPLIVYVGIPPPRLYMLSFVPLLVGSRVQEYVTRWRGGISQLRTARYPLSFQDVIETFLDRLPTSIPYQFLRLKVMDNIDNIDVDDISSFLQITNKSSISIAIIDVPILSVFPCMFLVPPMFLPPLHRLQTSSDPNTSALSSSRSSLYLFQL